MPAPVQQDIPKGYDKKVGKTAWLSVKSLTGKQEELSVPVKVLEVKVDFGRTHFRATPVRGSGQQWVTLNRMSF